MFVRDFIWNNNQKVTSEFKGESIMVGRVSYLI